MRWGTLALTLSLLLVLQGCLGSVTGAEIPEQRLSQENWRETRDDSSSLFLGMGQLVIREYAPVSSFGGLGAGITVATLNDIPIVDEREQLVPRAIEQVEKDKGVRFEDPSAIEYTLTGLGTTVSATEYAVRGGPQPGKALLVTPSCGDFVAMVAWGATTSGSDRLLGGSGDGTLYDEAKRVARYVQC